MTASLKRDWMIVLAMATCTAFATAAEVTAKIHVSADTGNQASVANVVVWLTPVDSPAPRPVPRTNLRLIQKNKEFSPHLLVVPTGSSVDFPNLDPFFHNVFSLFNGKRFDLGLYEAGTHRSVTFDREGVSYIFCNIHPEMGAVVVALSSPWFAISDANGFIAIRDVPPGRYRVQTWSEQLALSPSTRANEIIDVPFEGYALGNLEFSPTNAVTSHHKNKFGKDYPPDARSPY